MGLFRLKRLSHSERLLQINHPVTTRTKVHGAIKKNAPFFKMILACSVLELLNNNNILCGADYLDRPDTITTLISTEACKTIQ